MLTTLLAQTLSILTGNYTMNDAQTIRSRMPSTEAIVYTPEVNKLYTTIIDLCKEASAEGSVNRRFNQMPIACTDETGAVVFERLRNQGFDVIKPISGDTIQFLQHQGTQQKILYTTITNRFTVGWGKPKDVYCDALYVQWHNPEMVLAAINRTVHLAYSDIIDSCDYCALAGRTAHFARVEQIVYVNWEMNISVRPNRTEDIVTLLREKLIQQGFTVAQDAGSEHTSISW